MRTILNLLLQTAAQKSITLVGLGCIAAMFLIFAIEKSKFSSKQKPIIWTFFALFMAAFLLYYFFVVK